MKKPFLRHGCDFLVVTNPDRRIPADDVFQIVDLPIEKVEPDLHWIPSVAFIVLSLN
ncbi:hypothetical protein [Arundinibacter roseus]|uniref:hypothetical protein n=1 Tax=Arundinibacter roseus TaxID=2070510 RepID=UPI00140485C9|nr:hypothetical protein [Arundinibacter roseus]